MREPDPTITMRGLLRVVGIGAGLSVVLTIWFIANFFALGGMSSLVAAGMLGIATPVGWAVTLALGPFVAVQLWRYRESGRRAGLILFATGLAYYVIGFVAFRSPEARSSQIAVAAAMYAVPLVVLVSRQARRVCARTNEPANG